MKTTATLCLVLGLVACGKKGGEELTYGKAAEPFGPFAKLAFGMPDGDAVKAVPGFEFKGFAGRTRAGKHEFEVKTDPRRSLNVMRATLKDTKPEVLTKAWGPGLAGVDVLGKPTTYYVNEARTVRAEVQPLDTMLTVEFLPMTPLATYVSDDATTVAGIKLLGATMDDAWKAASQAGFDMKRTQFKGPITEWGAKSTLVTYDVAGEQIAGYTVFLDTKLSPTAKDETLATLEKKWGKPTVTKNSIGDDEIVFKAEGPSIKVRPSNDSLYLTVKQ